MKNRIPLFLLVLLFAVGSIAFAGKPKAAKAVRSTDQVATFSQSAARAFSVNAFKHPTKIADFTYVVGTTTYNYMWNSGGPRHIVYYNGIAYMIWVDGQGSGRQCLYSSFDGTNWLSPEAVISPSTQATYFSGIDVWRGGDADGVAGVGAGWAGAGTSYYGIEGSPGGGSFTTHAIDGNRDIQVTNLDSVGTVIENNSWGRTNYAVELSTDFGATWAVLDSNLLKYCQYGQTLGCLEPPIEVSASGTIYMNVMVTGKDYIPPVGMSSADSANQWGYFKSTNKGVTWTYNRICADGIQYDVNRYSLFTNLAQHDMVVDASDRVHAVVNGYHFISLDPGIDTIFQNGFDVVYWDATNGFKSLVNFNRSDTIIDNAPQGRFGSGVGGNNYGCSYPSIAETPDGKYILCTWTQPSWTSAGIDTNVAGFITSNIWYNLSADGGATWWGAKALSITPGVIQAFSSQAHDLQFVPGPPDSLTARILYLEMPNVAGSQTGAAPPAGDIMYQEFHPPIIIWIGVSERRSDVPVKFGLEQNFPNPFNPSTTIRYELPRASVVRLTVYDMLGREVIVLVNERKNSGSYEVNFDGSGLASGVYVYRLQSEGFVQAKKLLLLK